MKTITKSISATLAGIALAGGLAVVPVTAASAAPSGCVAQVLRAGSSNASCVRRAQIIMNYNAFRNGRTPLVTDGVFGNGTDQRVRQIQSDWWIGSDGIIGRGTWNVLCTHKSGNMSTAQKAAGCLSILPN
jgi:peptidoglycan hydrolase-like protein with peptidoglycan-binding domain